MADPNSISDVKSSLEAMDPSTVNKTPYAAKKEYPSMGRLVMAMMAVYVTTFLVALVCILRHYFFMSTAKHHVGQNHYIHRFAAHHGSVFGSLGYRLVRFFVPPYPVRNPTPLGQDLHLLFD